MPDPQKTIYINFFDSIDPIKVNKFIRFTVDAIQQHNPTEIYYFFPLLAEMLILGLRSTTFWFLCKVKLQSPCTILGQ